MRFPVTIRHRASSAKIYAPAGKFAYYRVAYATAGKRRMQTFAAYSDAKAAAERIVREMANGSQAAALNASQFQSHDNFLRWCHGASMVTEGVFLCWPVCRVIPEP